MNNYKPLFIFKYLLYFYFSKSSLFQPYQEFLNPDEAKHA